MPCPAPDTILDLGCGDCAASYAYRAIWPTAHIFGVDINITALRAGRIHAPAWRVQADIQQLPFGGVSAPRFDLVFARHPNIFKGIDAWHAAIKHSPMLLIPGGYLVLTAYAAEEVLTVRDWLAGEPSLAPLDIPSAALAPPDLAGRDRFVVLYHHI